MEMIGKVRRLRLRKKLTTGPDRFVINVWGVGYRLVDGPIER